MKGLPSSIWEKMKGLPSSIWEKMKGLPSSIWEKIKGLGSRIWDKMKGMASAVWEGVKDLPSSIANALGGGVKKAGGWLKDKVPGLQKGGIIRRGGLYNVHSNEAVVPLERLEHMLEGITSSSAHVQISGGLAPFIEKVQSDPNVRR